MSIQQNKRPVVIGVTGGSGSGKTTVSNKIYDQLHGQAIQIINQDTYYNDQSDMTMDERKAVNYDHPLAFDTDFLIKQLTDLRSNKAIEMPVYDYAQYTRSAQTVHVEPTDVIILEGIFALAEPTVRQLCDILVYVDTDSDIRFIRRLRRDIEERGRSLDSVCQQYLKTVRPMHEQFIEPSKKYAHIIIPEGGSNHVAVDLLMTKIKSIVDE